MFVRLEGDFTHRKEGAALMCRPEANAVVAVHHKEHAALHRRSAATATVAAAAVAAIF